MMSGSENLLDQMRTEAIQCFKASLKPVNPYEAVKRFVRLEGSQLKTGPEEKPVNQLNIDDYERIFLVGGGKATAPMARAMEDLLRDRITKGLIVVKYGFTDELSYTETVEADHPLPDRNGVSGTKKILELTKSAGDRDLVFSLISGGGSALLPQPAGNILLEEKQAMTQKLLKCGASIDEINCIRKHISSTKGGQMARSAFPATTINLMLSDVVGDRMDVIASGPFVPDMSSFKDARGIIEKYKLEDIPESVKNHLKAGMDGNIEDTPKEGDPVFDKVYNLIIGSNILALEAAEEEAKKLGYKTLILSSMIEGETKDIAGAHCAIAREIVKTGRPMSPPCCIISGGETTVTIKGKGMGGRNQEFCLVSAMDISDMKENVVMLSGGTDGNDGPTDAAGGIVDPLTLKRGKTAGISAVEYFNNNDSYNYLKKTGDLLITGPTKTNVMDVRMVLVK
ncbi:MAG: glycerate kinase [Desulfobacteraceae bacterium]|jgi:hydroxypyruvate reductase